MTLYKNVTSKPWETRGLLGGLSPQPSFAMPSAKVALILFMVVATVLFSLFAITYYLRMTLGDWVPMENPSQLWLNTALLVLSSVVFQWTRARLERNPAADVRLPFLIGGGLALAFVLGQLLVWEQLNGRGLYLSNDPAAAFFYLLTGMHVLHLLGGLWVWARTSLLLFLKSEEDGSNSIVRSKRILSIELCTLYWHFLLLVWIALFAMLANT